ncbi:hypothetical protein [Reyranella sp.]|uniref:hypothetical protein n=1 Tax=Reyranella sp. TaxID=1929291 RepID=UPI003D126560
MKQFAFVPLEACHVKQVRPQSAQQTVKIDLHDALAAELAAGRAAETLLCDGFPVACGGLLDEQAGRAKAWTLIGEAMPRAAWPALVERMRTEIGKALDPDAGWAHRVWAETVYDWAAGHKLLLHLGMEYEGLTRGTFGRDRHAAIYARVRGDVAALPIRVRCMNMTAERCLWEDSLGGDVPWPVEQAMRERRAA